jgi:hypothetical protein
MTTKKRIATSKSKKASVKRGGAKAAKKVSSKLGGSAKSLAKGQVISSHYDQIKHGMVKVLPKGKSSADFAKFIEPVNADTKKAARKKASTPRGSSSTAPVVYQTLRERVAAVEKNIGQKQTLKDFLDSVGWK